MASLADVVKGVQETNDLLRDNVRANERVQALMANSASIDAAARMDALGGSKKAPVKGGPKGFRAGFKRGFGGGVGGLLMGVVSSLFAAGSGLLAAITGGIGLALGSLILPAAAVGLIVTFGEKLIIKLLEDLDPTGDMIPDEDKKEFANGVVKSLVVGIGLALFSKPLGIAAFLAGVLIAGFKTRLSNTQKTGFEKDILDGAGEEWGITFSRENMMQLGAAVAGLFVFSKLKGALLFALGAENTRPGRSGGGFMGRFAKGFVKRGVIGLLISSISGIVGDKVAELTGTPGNPNVQFGKIVGDTLNAAAFGFAIAGPYGALGLALISLTVAGLNWAERHFAEKEANLDAELTKKLADKRAEEGEKAAFEAAQLQAVLDKRANRRALFLLANRDNSPEGENLLANHLAKMKLQTKNNIAEAGLTNLITDNEAILLNLNTDSTLGREGGGINQRTLLRNMMLDNPHRLLELEQLNKFGLQEGNLNFGPHGPAPGRKKNAQVQANLKFYEELRERNAMIIALNEAKKVLAIAATSMGIAAATLRENQVGQHTVVVTGNSRLSTTDLNHPKWMVRASDG